jgi:hypothetical protein
MAYARIDLSGELSDGQFVTFKAPCDCTAITGFRVYYPKNGEKLSKEFTMKDTHGNDLAGIGNLFMAGSYVTAVLDTVNNIAYLQNADTNTYLEERISGMETSFITAANEIGDAIVALGVDVPEGTDLHGMALIIEEQLFKRSITETQTGKDTIGVNSSMTSNTKVVPFPQAFQGKPTVSVSRLNGGGKVEAIDISEGGFTLKITGSWTNVATYQIEFEWVATYTRE